MPDPDEQVYRDAALAFLGAQGYKLSRETQHALAAGRQRDPGFRAAVKLAYQAGREDERKEAEGG